MIRRAIPLFIQFAKKRSSRGEKFLPFGEQISCRLCYSRYTTLTAYNAHKLLPTHTSRERWLEMKKWMQTSGRKYLHAAESEEFRKYGKCNGGRRSRMNIDETFNPGVVPPRIHPPASEIIEPCNNRWPNDIKPRIFVKPQ
ncbi:Zinc finger C2H2 [Perkinsela sp. CCAP 1560/4]|nr:Zinc finger C2H2 [Perkinsela sp. CCAP 1560/4]|eukprot:KNH02433.1 Zinc finger C2H2 [Perkinsela sp. CCAP 1560/4]